jgi:sugar-specific transcriptional regulator TrmB
LTETMLEEMKQLGFTGAEAQIYIFLLRHPLSTGYEASKGTGLPRANTYQALESLSTKERVTVVSSDPIRYAPIPPTRLLKRIRAETELRCRDLERRLADLEQPDGVGHFWELERYERIVARMLEVIAQAEQRIVASLWAEDLVLLADALRAARDRGCVVILNLFGVAQADFATIYQHEEPEKVVGGHVVALAVDFNEALVASLDSPATGVVTQNRTLVRLVEKFIRDEAYLAAIYERFSPELEAAFGPHLVDLRRRLLPEAAAKRLVAITASGSQSIELPSTLQ